MEIAELITHPEQLDKDTLHALREQVAQYPYYQAARLLFLKNLFLLHDPLFGEELRKAALFLPDRRVIFDMVEGGNYAIQPTPLRREPHEQPAGADRTVTLIDDYLRAVPDAPATRPAGRQPTAADATTDYAAFLLQLDDAPAAPPQQPTRRSDTLIDDFIENRPERIRLQENPEFTPELPADTDTAGDNGEEGFLTLTLAKIYIRQQRYEKALEIMRKVSMKNPKKSAYFADQIRFLQKLIINKNHQKQ